MKFAKNLVFIDFFRQKICTIQKNDLPLHPQLANIASVAQLVRAPDC